MRMVLRALGAKVSLITVLTMYCFLEVDKSYWLPFES